MLLALVMTVVVVVWQPNIVSLLGPWSLFVNAGWILFLARASYDNSDRVFKTWNRWKLWWANRSIEWESNIEFRCVRNENALRDARAVVQRRYKDRRVELLTELPERLSIDISSIGVLTIDYLEDGLPQFDGISTAPAVVLRLRHTPAGYRDVVKMLDEQYQYLIQELRDALDSASGKYGLRASFRGANPYFGLYVRHIAPPNMVAFDLEFRETLNGGTHEIFVGKDHLEIVTWEFLSFFVLARRYLALG